MIAAISDGDKLKRMAAVICLLPPGNLLIFERLIGMFVKISEHSKVNKMAADNLAIVFAPTLLRYNCTDLTKLLAHSEAANNVIRIAIVNYEELFTVSILLNIRWLQRRS